MRKFVTTMLITMAATVCLSATPVGAAQPVKISNTTKTMYVGRNCKLTVTRGKKVVAVKQWKSSNQRVATVKNGTVKALRKGTATITATTRDGLVRKCNVTVKSKTAGVKLSKTSGTVAVGKSTTLYLTRANKRLSTMRVTSSNKSVATVKKSGTKIVVTGKKAGKATISVKFGGKVFKYTTTVKSSTSTSTKWAQSLSMKAKHSKTTEKVTFSCNVKKTAQLSVDYLTSTSLKFTVSDNVKLNTLKFSTGGAGIRDYDPKTGSIDKCSKSFDFSINGNTVTISGLKRYRPTGALKLQVSGDTKSGGFFCFDVCTLKNTTKGADWDTKHNYKADGYTWDCAWTKTVIRETAEGPSMKPDDFGILEYKSASGKVKRVYEVNIDLGNDEILTIYGWYDQDDNDAFVANCNRIISNCPYAAPGAKLNSVNTGALQNYAIVRAAEGTVKYGHQRPNGVDDWGLLSAMPSFDEPGHVNSLASGAFCADYVTTAGAGFTRYSVDHFSTDTTGRLGAHDEQLRDYRSVWVMCRAELEDCVTPSFSHAQDDLVTGEILITDAEWLKQFE